MGLNWTKALRFAPGTALRFSLRLQPALHSALLQAMPSARYWLERIEGAVLTVVAADSEGCEVHARVGAGTQCAASFTATPSPDGAYCARIEWAADTGPLVRDFKGIALMLGGERDVYMTSRTEAKPRQLSRWHYEPDGSVTVSIYPAALSSQLSAVVRALLPTELSVGRLQPVAKTGDA
jgi:hypothetical protein